MDGGRILAFILALALAASPAPSAAETVCGGGLYKTNSTYETNLHQVAGTLPTNASSSPVLFATAHIGGVFALALCQGDLNSFTCLNCLYWAFQDAQQFCASHMDVAIYSSNCNMRFSNQDFLDSTNYSQKKQIFSVAPALSSSAAEGFNHLVAELLNATVDYAVANSTTRFATGEVDVNADDFDGQFSKIYTSARCTPDLKKAQCGACLASAMADLPQLVFPRNSPGATVVGERCNLRFDVFSFYNIDAMVRLQVGQGAHPLPPPPFPCPLLTKSVLSMTAKWMKTMKRGESDLVWWPL